jgi:glycosyltransferase involved in cell wall biosynthesis
LRWPLYYLVRYGQWSLANLVRNLVLVVPDQVEDLHGGRIRSRIIRNYASTDLLDTVRDDYEKRPDAVVFTGGHYAENGSFLFLDIAREFRRRNSPLKFYASKRFASPAVEQEMLRRMRDEDLTNIELLPYIPSHEIMLMLNRGTVGLAPQLRVRKQLRALPTKMFEYMAAGIPVVGSDLPKVTEVIGGNEAGILAQPENPLSFVDAIRKLMEDRALARRLGANGQRAFRERYSWESQMPELLAFYNLILGALPEPKAAAAVQPA